MSAGLIGWAVEALVGSALLMALVLAIRGTVRREFGAGVAYALWLLPVARLLLPPLPGEWGMSHFFEPVIARAADHGIAAGVLNAERLPPAVRDHALATVEIAVGPATPAHIALVPPVEAFGGPSPLLLIGALWLLGALGFVGWHIVRHAAFCARLMRRARRREAIAGQRIDMIVSDAATGPLAFGIWRKCVAFPSDFDERYDDEERALALAHELTHHARGDLIANWVALVTLGLHWFNPIAWRAFRAFRADQEMACDAQVLAGRNPALRHAYGRAIMKSAHGGAVSAACHLHTINDLKGRLRMLMNTNKSRARIIGGTALVAVLALAGLGMTASGSQAAEKLRSQASVVSDGGRHLVDTAFVAHVNEVPAVPAAPLAPAARIAPAAPAAPQASPVPQAEDTPPPAQPKKVEQKRIFIVTNANGKVQTVDVTGESGSKDVDPEHVEREIRVKIPEVIDGKCGEPGKGGEVVRKETVNGKQRIIICSRQIEFITKDAQERAANAHEIERSALHSALSSLRETRARMAANASLSGDARAEALKGIDEAIAEVEADLAKAN